MTIASDWGTGYCADVQVENPTAAEVTWEVVLAFDGTINSIWNAEVTDLGGGDYSFVGVSWNATLAPAGTAAFGLCAQR